MKGLSMQINCNERKRYDSAEREICIKVLQNDLDGMKKCELGENLFLIN
jgi:hypothetical protein